MKRASAAIVLMIVVLAVISGCGRSREFDLEPVRQRLEQDIAAAQNSLIQQSRIHDLRLSDAWLSVVIELPSAPASEIFAQQQAQRWATLVANTQIEGQPVHGLIEGGIKVDLCTGLTTGQPWTWGCQIIYRPQKETDERAALSNN